MEDEKTYCLVVSANQRKAYPIAKSLARMGFKVIAAFHAWRSTVFSRFFHKRFKIMNPYKNPQGYLKQLKILVRRYNPIVVPVGFIDVKFSRGLVAPILAPPPELFDRASDKLALSEICKEAGVRYPFTMRKNIATESLLTLPWFRMGKWITKRRSEDKESEDIFQKHIGGYGAGYFAIAKEGRILAEYAHRRVIEHQGVSLVSEFSDDRQIIENGRKLVRALKWTGPIMVEFRCEFKHFVIEVNPKFWGSLEMATAWGVDFPRYLLEMNSNSETRISGGFSWILAGITAFLKTEPRKWFRMVWNAFRRRHKTDVHLDDPIELLYGVVTRLWNVIRNG